MMIVTPSYSNILPQLQENLTSNDFVLQISRNCNLLTLAGENSSYFLFSPPKGWRETPTSLPLPASRAVCE
jgi:hypothetical protein